MNKLLALNKLKSETLREMLNAILNVHDKTVFAAIERVKMRGYVPKRLLSDSDAASVRKSLTKSDNSYQIFRRRLFIKRFIARHPRLWDKIVPDIQTIKE